MTNNNWEKKFDEKAKDLCIAFISDGEGEETNLYLSNVDGYDEIKQLISQLLSFQKQKLEQEFRKTLNSGKKENNTPERFPKI